MKLPPVPAGCHTKQYNSQNEILFGVYPDRIVYTGMCFEVKAALGLYTLEMTKYLSNLRGREICSSLVISVRGYH